MKKIEECPQWARNSEVVKYGPSPKTKVLFRLIHICDLIRN